MGKIPVSKDVPASENKDMKILSKSFNFPRVFQSLPEHDRGAFINAIVVYGKKPWTVEARTLTPFEREVKGYAVETRVVTYRHYLKIDLWFINMDFTFETNG